MPVIEVKNLQKYFGKTKAVDDISLTVEKGEIFGFLGPNGAGKTTTIRCLMDFIRPTAGSIQILGLDSKKDSVPIKKKVGFLSGLVHLYDKWTGAEHIDFTRRLNGTKDIVEELIGRFDFDPNIKAKNLSSGNRQKLGIILAFMSQPEVLILDEPTNALDPLLQNEMYELLKKVTKDGATIFMSSHNLSEVDKICHHVGIIKQGKMVATESIQSLKDKRMNKVQVQFADHFDKNEFVFEGVQIVHALPDSLILNVKGDINQLLRKLSTHTLKDFHIEHAPLEDIFMEFYEK
jgi:ABC-2 type transport system ATP-binding protein